ncbi:MAG: hypothetical protein AB7O44_30365 [Hyphomicrobiaceae bacterium]
MTTTGNPATQTTEEPKAPLQESPEVSADPTNEEALRLLDQANAGRVAAEEKKHLEAGKPLKKAEPKLEPDKRDEIAKRHREYRKTEMRGEATDINDPNLTNSAHATGDQAPPADQQAKAEGQGQDTQPKVQEPVRREVELIVDGKTVKQMLTDEEILTAAKATLQKDRTADYRLQNATLLQKEAQQRLATMDGSRTAPPTRADGEVPADANGSVPTGDQGKAPTDKKADAFGPEKLKDIATRLQVGTADEAVSALSELVNAVAPQQPVDITSQVQSAIRRDRDISASTEAMKDFAVTHAATFSKENDPQGVAGYVFKNLVVGEMIKDLQKAGYSNEVLDSYGLRDPNNEAALKVAHQAMRINGNEGIRSVKDIMNAAVADPGFKAYAKTGQTQPAPKVDVNRQDRKDGLPQQPAQRGAPPQLAAKTAEETRNSGMSSAVRKMRESRGQATAAI